MQLSAFLVGTGKLHGIGKGLKMDIDHISNIDCFSVSGGMELGTHWIPKSITPIDNSVLRSEVLYISSRTPSFYLGCLQAASLPGHSRLRKTFGSIRILFRIFSETQRMSICLLCRLFGAVFVPFMIFIRLMPIPP